MTAKKKTGPSTLKGSGRRARWRWWCWRRSRARSGRDGGGGVARDFALALLPAGGPGAGRDAPALEPKGRGPQKTPERRDQGAPEAEKKQLEKELRRQQTLLRAAHRTVGLSGRRTGGGSSKKRGRTKRGCRGRTVRQTLRRTAPEEVHDGTTQRDGDAGGADRSQS